MTRKSRRSRTLWRSALLAVVLVSVPWPAAGTAEYGAHRPINEGADTRPCVTRRESNVVDLDMSRMRIRRIVDTPGEVVSRHALDSVAAMFPPKYAPERAPWRFREVRAYPVCPRPRGGIPGGVMLVEYDLSQRRVPAVMMRYQED